MSITKRPLPSGLRSITASQRRATVGLTGRFPPTTPGQVLSAFKKYAQAVGLSRRLVDLIDQLMSYTRAADWRDEWPPHVWPSNAELAECLGLERSRLKELLRAAIDAGFIIPNDQDSRRRCGVREQGTDRILWAYGFDLSPLAERMPSFRRAATEHKARKEEAAVLRKEIGRLRSFILAAAEFGDDQAIPGIDWQAASYQAREVAATARSHPRNPLHLQPIAIQLQKLRQQIDAALDAVFSVESVPQGPNIRPLYTATNQLPRKSKIAKDGEAPAQEIHRADNRTERAADRPRMSNVLRGFPMTPLLALQIAPAFRALVPTARPSWAQVSEAAFLVSSRMGISPHAYGQACLVLGRYETATAVAAIAAKLDAGLVRSPGGLLRHMVDAHQAGTLRLDRTLFGLTARAGVGHSIRPANSQQWRGLASRIADLGRSNNRQPNAAHAPTSRFCGTKPTYFPAIQNPSPPPNPSAATMIATPAAIIAIRRACLAIKRHQEPIH